MNQESWQQSPHIYEVAFRLDNRKRISYIGRSSGNSRGYISGSTELRRSIANTVIQHGYQLAALGWSKICLATFDVDTPESTIREEEKRLIQESLSASIAQGPGRAWEILNKEHLHDVWRHYSSPIHLLLNSGANLPHNDGANVASTKQVAPTDAAWGSQTHSTFEPPQLDVHANILGEIETELNDRLTVDIAYLAQPHRKRTDLKMRLLICALQSMALHRGHSTIKVNVRYSTLKHLLTEPNLSTSQARESLQRALKQLKNLNNSLVLNSSFGKSNGSFEVSLLQDLHSTDKVVVSLGTTMKLASIGPTGSLARRYITIHAAEHVFVSSGKGLNFDTAISLMTGKKTPPKSDMVRRAEAQSTCARGLKQSIGQLEATMGTKVAVNYFTKRKLIELQAQFPSMAGALTVLIDNAERKYADLYALRIPPV